MSEVLWSAREAASATNGQLLESEDWSATGLSIDTRTLQKGDLFIALKDQRNGHDFVSDAFEKGAVAALVSEDDCAPGAKLLVGNTLEGLQSLARHARDRSSAIRVGVTGSVGKTSVKEALAKVFRSAGSTHASQKSYNNHWGVPLTLALTPKEVDRAVYEMGMNHAGEIRHLSTLARPHVALITKIAPAHLENLGSMEAIADAKSEIFEGLNPDGVAVYPADDDFAERLFANAQQSAAAFLIDFGRASNAAVRLLEYEAGPTSGRGKISVLGKVLDYQVGAGGEHWAWNSAAIFATAIAAGVDGEVTAEALRDISAAAGRGSIQTIKAKDREFVLIDDSYNANPASMASGLSVLGATAPKGGRRIAVLGEMLELGPESADLHKALTKPLEKAGVDAVFLSGKGTEPLAEVLPSGQLISWSSSADDLSQKVAEFIQTGDVVFIKGSNASGVHRIARMLSEMG